MDILEDLTSNEKVLALRAAAMHVPFAGTFELTPSCNMNCRMCYIRHSRQQTDRQGGVLPASSWIRIASEARELGTLYLLLTGGEPMLYPGFDELYTWLGTSGIMVMLNTNGTMMTEAKADLIRKYPPVKVNISLYGASEETYRKVCGYSGGFDRVIMGIRMLKERNIPVKLNCSLTALNYQDLAAMHGIADELDVPFQVTGYMFPPVRREGADLVEFTRFTPEKAAEAMIVNARISLHDEDKFRLWVNRHLMEYEAYNANPTLINNYGFSCFASKNNFWINWKGQMLPCGMMPEAGRDVLERGFAACWNDIGEAGKKIRNPDKCCRCDMRSLCMVCTAACIAETGCSDQAPDYLCEMTESLLQMLQQEKASFDTACKDTDSGIMS